MSYEDSSVIGTDSVVPVHAPNDRWTAFSEEEIWLGGEGLQPDGVRRRFVPKVYDHVVRPTTNERWYVESIDPISLIPTLRRIEVREDHDLTEEDVLAGVGPVQTRDNFRVYIDTTYTPYVMIVDAQLKVAGEDVTFAKIFRGSDIGNQGKVVSKIYDGMGNFISENVPLALAAAGFQTNYAIKVVQSCNTVETFEDGELLTVVFYNDKGGVVSRSRLMAENTNAVRARETEDRQITHISLNSPFMSKSVDDQIDFPLNFTMNSLNLMGTVHYSDGSTLSLPVDGRKFTLEGLEQHLSTIVGQKVPMVLTYALSEGESSHAVAGDNRTVVRPYTLVTTNPNYSYSVKLFGYPDWKGEYEGYHMRWWLLNLERNVHFEVTPFVRYVHTQGSFDPKAYGIVQRKQVSINLKDVSGSFKSFNHTQKVDIILNAPPSVNNTPWLVSQESMETRPYYGEGLVAKRVSGNRLDISSGFTSLEDWLDALLVKTFPLVHRDVEVSYPTPTHVEVSYGNHTRVIPLNEWNQELSHDGSLRKHSLVVLRFMKRTATGDLSIAVSAMIVDS